MRFRSVLIALAVLATGCSQEQTPQKATGLVPVDEAGVQKVIEGHRGKAVLVNFWATWCLPCREEMPELVKLENRMNGKPFQLVVISTDEPEQAQDAFKFVESNRVPAPSYIKQTGNNDKFINAFDPEWTGAVPALFLYDRTGKRVKSWIGEAEIASVESAIRELVN